MENTLRAVSPVDNPVLLKSVLFAFLSELEFNAVLAFLERRKIPKNGIVFNEGDAGTELFVLLSGSLKAYVSKSDGTQAQLFEIKPGDFFGEMSIIANEPRSATLTAKEDTELMVLAGIDFYRIIFEHPMIGVKLLRAICRVQNAWLDRASKHLSDLTRWGETARRRVIIDEQTGLYNRRFLEDSIRDRFARGSVGLRKIALLMMDIDKVHDINNKHGQEAGDTVINRVADIIRTFTRSNDIAARLSGDEFAVLLPDTNGANAKIIAERIRESVFSSIIRVPEKPGSRDKIEVAIRISIGIAVAPDNADSIEALSIAADGALRKAKDSGRNRIELA
ncbi:GGDEF domain-containing protein [Breznakiellaceae bacterium SP9]